jgi:hypothetical protein
MKPEWWLLSGIGVAFVLALYWMAPVREWANVTVVLETAIISYGLIAWPRNRR